MPTEFLSCEFALFFGRASAWSPQRRLMKKDTDLRFPFRCRNNPPPPYGPARGRPGAWGKNPRGTRPARAGYPWGIRAVRVPYPWGTRPSAYGATARRPSLSSPQAVLSDTLRLRLPRGWPFTRRSAKQTLLFRPGGSPLNVRPVRVVHPRGVHGARVTYPRRTRAGRATYPRRTRAEHHRETAGHP